MSTLTTLAAVRGVAAEFGLAVEVSEDIGADEVARRTAAPLGTLLDSDGTVPHDAWIELGGRPSVTVRLYADDDATIDVEGIEFADVPHASVAAFVRAVHAGSASIRTRLFSMTLIVSLPGDETYREHVTNRQLTPWLNSRIR